METNMLLRLAALGAIGYAAYRYYDNNRDEVDGALRRLSGREPEADYAGPAGGPISNRASVVHAGESPVD
jgi:hypothetical protein